MNWINVHKEKPSVGHFESVDVWVCCGGYSGDTDPHSGHIDPLTGSWF